MHQPNRIHNPHSEQREHSSAYSSANSSGSAPTKPVPCTTGYVNGVCGSGSTTGGNHGPGLPGGACPSGQVRGPNGCTGPKTGSTISSGSSTHYGAGQNTGGKTTLPISGHGNTGAQSMSTRSGSTQSLRGFTTQSTHSQGTQFSNYKVRSRRTRRPLRVRTRQVAAQPITEDSRQQASALGGGEEFLILPPQWTTGAAAPCRSG